MAHSNSTATPDFRKDINGLRAWAVVIVILYHFGVPGFRGGFVGVDVFFVISGFLMTGIISRGLTKGSFSITGFYLARARRIMPALIVLCAVVLAAGWLILPPTDYQTLGVHTVHSLFFLSNAKFLSEAGYFDTASHEKWLLHTWSLAVEWQFYLVFPLLLMAAWRMRPGITAMRFAVGAGFVSSLFMTLTTSTEERNAAFFLLHTRAWELFAGGLVFLYATRGRLGWRQTVELIGFCLILIAVVWLDARSEWPGWRTLLPVGGAALVLLANNSDSGLTGHRLPQWIGDRSYSLYLWHWPIFVGLCYLELNKDPIALTLAIGVTVLISHVSFSFVETGSRGRLECMRPRYAWSVLLATATSVAVAGQNIADMVGLPERIPVEARRITNEMTMPLTSNGWCMYSVDTIDSLAVGTAGLDCRLGKDVSETRGLLFGDSHAGHYSPFWHEVARHSGIAINTVATNWCYPSLTADFTGPISSRAYPQCLINRTYLRSAISDYDFVIFSGSWRSISEMNQLAGVLEAITFAAERSKLVIVMPAPTSFEVNVSKKYIEKVMLGQAFEISRYGKRSDRKTRAANDRLSEHASTFPNVIFLERNALFHIGGRPSDVTDENAPYSLDGSHLSIYGSKKSAAAFMQTQGYAELQQRLAAIRHHTPRNVVSTKEIDTQALTVRGP